MSAYYLTLYLRVYSARGEVFFTWLNRLIGVRETGELGQVFRDFYVASAPRIILLLICSVCILYAVLDLYAGRRSLLRRKVAADVVLANIAALLIFYTYFYLTRNRHHPRSFFGVLMVVNAILCVGFRGLLEQVLIWARRTYAFDVCRVVVMESPDVPEDMLTYIDKVQPHGLICVGRVAYGDGDFSTRLARMRAEVSRRKAHMVIAFDASMDVGQIMELLEACNELGIAAKVGSRTLDVLPLRAHVPADPVNGIPLVHFDAPSAGGKMTRVRQVLSVVSAACGLVVLFPLGLLIALLVRLSGPGPILFVQERIGVNRKPFRMYKFRTMHHGADELQAELEELTDKQDTLFKIREDPRITRVGRFLRRFSLDELPQLINVVRGEMLLVGPRPLPRRDFENYYEQWHYSRHAGLPGLTCLWQVSGRSDLDFHDMCLLDIYYLRNHTWVLDLKILFRTIRVVLFADGAY